MSQEVWIVIATAIGLLLLIEGLLYAMVPGWMRMVMAEAIKRPTKTLRVVGTAALTIGIALLWWAHG
jgi:uncharacterized protein YjeT (DUF2065 family)